jgi:Domain of unknown function (DUF4159)
VTYSRLLIALLTAVLAPTASAALFAQLGFSQGQGQGQEPRPRIWVGGDRGFGRIRREPTKWAEKSNFDGGYNFCRGYYTSDRPENGGMGWWTDYPGADNNFSVRLAELTYVRVKMKEDGQPDNVVVRLTDPLLYHCPILHMEDVGTIRFSDEEVESLRNYLLKGGFLYVDDFWGTLAWEQWSYEIARVLPPHKYPIVDIPHDHAILHTLYDVKDVPQVPSINRWYQMDGGTSERGADSPYVNFRGIQDDHGRLMVVMSHNTDISDTWEREGENKEYFDRFSPDGYAVGVNIALYAFTH